MCWRHTKHGSTIRGRRVRSAPHNVLMTSCDGKWPPHTIRRCAFSQTSFSFPSNPSLEFPRLRSSFNVATTISPFNITRFLLPSYVPSHKFSIFQRCKKARRGQGKIFSILKRCNINSLQPEVAHNAHAPQLTMNSGNR